VHGARGNPTALRRRAYITRWLSADAREVPRSGPMTLPKNLRAFADYPRWPPK
jgi:ectoine hydroxylase-related dioxygenase (phytanoyl-CoA dioxygenase family)